MVDFLLSSKEECFHFGTSVSHGVCKAVAKILHSVLETSREMRKKYPQSERKISSLTVVSITPESPFRKFLLTSSSSDICKIWIFPYLLPLVTIVTGTRSEGKSPIKKQPNKQDPTLPHSIQKLY